MKQRILSCLLAVLLSLSAMAEVKYVFYFIGDGMGVNQINVTETYLAALKGKIGFEPLLMSSLPVVGMVNTYSATNGVTDSAAGGTALATGKKTKNGAIGVLKDLETPCYSIAQWAKNSGKAVGVATSVAVTHATPASFFGHQADRNMYWELGKDLCKSNFDFFGGSDFHTPYTKEGEPSLHEQAKAAGYTIVKGYKEYMKKGRQAEKLCLFQSDKANEKLGSDQIPYALDRTKDDLTLEQIVRAGINFLSSKNTDGFFFEVEGGMIDWACHSNDAATVIGEVQEFDKAIQVVYDFYKKHPKETLIIITADHETGGMALGNKKYTLDLQLLQNQKVSVGKLSDEIKALQEQYGKKLKWEQVKDLLQKEVGLYDAVPVKSEEDAELQQLFKHMLNNKAKDEKTLYAEVSALAAKAIKLLNKKAHVGWTTTSHSAAAVPVFAIGQGAELFTGWHDNSEVMPLILKATN